MPNGHGFSFPYGFSFVVFPVLAVAIAAGRGAWWSILLTVVAGALTAAFTWEGVSRNEFENIRRNDPTLNRITWVFNWLFFFAFPGLLTTLWGVAANFGKH
ncbi:MAG TPA: hypothetical protein VHA82_04845 [Ramlibacter sp.]|uniref:hypothetical protein n=1 Tax=Ramlibacter sp. TaxID=1917967 RepID=UPI002CB22C60|nr:hypothetical protein [Ramlibacter sp.]HVZ43118.1 hypothetical protein [Ramlibacter sp.]